MIHHLLEDDPRPPVHRHELALTQGRRGGARSDDAGDAELPGDDRGVAGDASRSTSPATAVKVAFIPANEVGHVPDASCLVTFAPDGWGQALARVARRSRLAAYMASSASASAAGKPRSTVMGAQPMEPATPASVSAACI